MGYAIAITEENIRGVILSEAGSGFDLVAALAWLDEYKEGWFIRDETSVLDCHLFTPETFAIMYMFTDNDQNVLMRKIEQI